MPRPNKPIIKNPTNGKWTINDVTLTISTTSNNNIIGKWYYKYGSGSYTDLNKNGKNTFTFKQKNEYIGNFYVKVCNKIASGYNDTKNCSEVASTQLKIEKTKPKVKFTKTGSLGESRVPDENKEKGYVVEDVYLDGYTVELSVSNSPPSGIKSRKMTCTGSKYFGYGTYKSSGFTTPYNTDTKKKFIPNLDPEKEEETYVIKITCAAEVKTNAGNVNSKTVAEGLIGNGWLTKDGIWNFKAYGKEVIGWKQIYWFTTDPDPNRDSIASKGSWDWYYFYNGNETYEKNHCHGSKGHMADGWCKCLPKIDGTGEYKKWFYFQRKVADEYLQPNDTTGKKWFYWGSMYLNGTNMSIGGEKYKFNSYGYCVEGRGCNYGDLSC